MFDILSDSLPTQYRKSSWRRSLKIYTHLLNIFLSHVCIRVYEYLVSNIEPRLLSIPPFFS